VYLWKNFGKIFALKAGSHQFIWINLHSSIYCTEIHNHLLFWILFYSVLNCYSECYSNVFRAKPLNTRHHSEGAVHSDIAGDDTQADRGDDKYTHLSSFALSGSDGGVRWHHVAGDFEKSHAKVLNSCTCWWIVKNFLGLLCCSFSMSKRAAYVSMQ